MTDRQLVAKYPGAIVQANTEDNELYGWRLHLKESLFNRLHQMAADPGFLLEIEQKTEACFAELMAERIEKFEKQTKDLSVAADEELTAFKKKAVDHLEECIQLATRSAHARPKAEIQASKLRNKAENQMNKHLQRLVAEAKSEARDYALTEIKTSLDRADHQLGSTADNAVGEMMKRFDQDAAERIRKILQQSFSASPKTLQTFADDHVVEIRRRIVEDIDRVFGEIRKKEERTAIALIKSHAIEETRLISTIIADKIDAIFNEARARHKSALAWLDERADAHATAVQQIQVKTEWLKSEADNKATIEQDVKQSL